MRRKLTTEEFIINAKNIHNNKYDYSKVVYIDAHQKINIICKLHGEFLQTPNDHQQGAGCPKCKSEKLSIKFRNTKEKFIKKSKKIHGNKYDYSKVNYVNCELKVKIICPNHGIFYQSPWNHYNGNGCPKCTKCISMFEEEFLNYLKIKEKRYRLPLWKNKTADGFDSKTNTIYEYLGDYYHGNPSKYNPSQYNQICHKTFGELYENTFRVLNKMKSLGYNVKYIWESDWKKFKDKKTNIPNIINHLN